MSLLHTRPLRASGEMPFLCCLNVEESWCGLRPEDEEATARLVEDLHLAELGLAEGQRVGVEEFEVQHWPAGA